MNVERESVLSVSSKLALRNAFRAGLPFAYPTEAVFGLGCDPWDAMAVKRLLLLKQRNVEKGLIVIASRWDQITPLLQDLSTSERKLLESSWPGPVTWSLPNDGFVPDYVTGGRSTVAVRLSSHPVVANIVDFIGRPIVSTSANPSSRSPARTALKCRYYFGESFTVIPGNLGGLKRPTVIRDLKSDTVFRS